MRDLLERSCSVRCAVVLLAAAAVLALVHAAAAEDDLGLRLQQALFWPLSQPVAAVRPVTGVPMDDHRPARLHERAGRPLRIALYRARHRSRRSVRHDQGAVVSRLARSRSFAAKRAAAPRLLFRPAPGKPAIVSIYEDRTLRRGDAVMLADGIHVFRGEGTWPHRPGDFVRLTLVASLEWHLRRTLDELDKNPPTRWSSIESDRG